MIGAGIGAAVGVTAVVIAAVAGVALLPLTSIAAATLAGGYLGRECEG